MKTPLDWLIITGGKRNRKRTAPETGTVPARSQGLAQKARTPLSYGVSSHLVYPPENSNRRPRSDDRAKKAPEPLRAPGDAIGRSIEPYRAIKTALPSQRNKE
jgi:hypothetical protein